VTDSALDSNTSGIALYDSDDATIYSNNIYGINDGNGAGHFGIKLYGSAAVDATITSNDIRYMGRSGIRARGYTTADALEIINNTIVSCGQADFIYSDGDTMGYGVPWLTCNDTDGCPAASGIQLYDSLISSDRMADNNIRYNPYSGIAINDISADSIIGPNNTIRYNGDGSSGNCDGGITVRNLDDGVDQLDINGNTITDNIVGSVTRRDCDGDVYIDGGPEVSCTPACTYP
jgi:hypothetical protein